MEKKLLKKLIREALGVPDNIVNTANQVYNKYISMLNWYLPKDKIPTMGWSDRMGLSDDYKIGDYEFRMIVITTNISYNPRVPHATVAGMGFTYKAKLDDKNFKMSIHPDTNFNNVELNITIVVNENYTPEEVLKVLNEDKQTYISSIAHELKHAYDKYKNGTQNLNTSSEYSLYSNSYFNLKPVDEFIHNLYFVHMIENLVRPTEVASAMDSLGIEKKDFINFLANNRTYKKLKEIHSFSLDKLKADLLTHKDELIDQLKQTSNPIPSTDEEFLDITLSSIFNRLKSKKLSGLVDTLSGGANNPFAALFGLTMDQNTKNYLTNYEKELNKFKNYQEYFGYEEKMFKFVSEKLMKKIHKLYAMAKDNPNVSALMQKINSKPTNESVDNSILDWDAHYMANNIQPENLFEDNDKDNKNEQDKRNS